MKKVLVLTNSINGLYSFRRELVEKLIIENYEVIISSPEDTKSSYFSNMGCKLILTEINRRGTNPLADLSLLYKYLGIIRKAQPDLVLTYTIKPNVYGGLACRLLKTPYIANITGLGTSIENKGALRTLSLFLYKVGLKKANMAFFQNKTNKDYFIENRIVNVKTSREIPGSGVNVDHHNFEEYPIDNDVIRFLFIGRIMRSKGIDELLEAAQIIKNSHPNTEFHFVGGKEENYDDKLKKEIIFYNGRQESVHTFIKDCHAMINPPTMKVRYVKCAIRISITIPGCIETFDQGIS
jgi:glycosyltransferase involved in cell wall biosynthesis